MNKTLAALLVVLALFAVYALYQTMSNPAALAYINLFDKCETSPAYGDLIDDTATTFRDAGLTDPATLRPPHGSRVEVLSATDDVAEIRSGTTRLYIAPSLISDYDPANGVRPDPTACAA